MRKLIFILILYFLPVIHPAMAQTEINNVFTQTDKFLKSYVENGYVDYLKIIADRDKLNEIVSLYENIDLNKIQSDLILKAFWINAYNITTIKSVIDNYPTSSPLKVNGFFNSIKHKVAQKNVTLDEIEKTILMPIDQDPRIHFVINCAAIGCPKLISDVYSPETLEIQLEERTKAVINDQYYVKVNEKEETVYLNEIFKWYKDDFLIESKSVIEYLNKYLINKIPAEYAIKYIQYDWKLNISSGGNSTGKKKSKISLQDFTPSTLLLPGQYEVKIFNNLYTQTSFFNDDSEKQDQNSRSTFNTILTSFLYGISNSVNVGFDLWIRSVKNDGEDESPLNVFDFKNSTSSRSALTSFGPKIKFDPILGSSLEGFTIQSAFLIPLVSNLEGSSTQPFLDSDTYLWLTQFFYDTRISPQFSFFGEVDTWIKIDRDLNGKRNSVQLPAKGFLSYYLNEIITFYGMMEISYKFGEGNSNSFYSQAGLGMKYQIFDGIELEGLVTNFYIGKNAGAGSTYNLGIRLVQ